MKTPYLILALLTAVASASVEAQPYEHAGGVRAGLSSGLTYKGFFLHSMNAVQADLYYNPKGLHIAALYVVHREPFRSDRWLAYAGGGPYGGNWEDAFAVGLTAVGGMEYMLRKLPLHFGIDWRPTLNIYRVTGTEFRDFGVTIRYRFRL